MVVHGEWDYGHMTVVTPPTREKKNEKKKTKGKKEKENKVPI